MPADDPTYDRLRRLLRERTELKAVWPSARLDAPYDIDVDLESHSADWDRRVSTLHTPAGDLTATYLVSRHRLPGLHETFFVDSAEAAETYLSLPLPDVGDDVSGFFAGDVEVGDAGIAEAGLGFNPAGFVAELQIFVGTFGVYPWLAAIGLLGILITAALFLQMLQQLFFGDLPRRWADFSDLGRVEVGALTVMGLLIVAIGIYPAWLLTLIDHASALLTGGGG